MIENEHGALAAMTQEEYHEAMRQLSPVQAWKLGALTGSLIRSAEQRGYDRAHTELATAAATPGGLQMAEPETYCHRCFRLNIPWTAPSPLWNEVMRGGDINGQEPFEGIVCPMCFMQLAEEKNIATGWRLDARNLFADLQYTTPSGRRWDGEQWLWVNPTETRG